MRMMIVATLAVLVSGGTAARASAVPQGDYTVVEARRDAAVNNGQARYRRNDPVLVGRVVSFAGRRASFDGDAAVCSGLMATSSRVPPTTLLAQAFPRRSTPGGARPARPVDFNLSLPAEPVSAVRFRCPSPVGPHGAVWDGRVAFPLTVGRVALSWTDGMLLVLAPAPAGASVAAGFDCTRAASPTEGAICSDRRLAGWDRSAMVAYKAVQDVTEDPDALRGQQRVFLADRSKCGSDKACLLQKTRDQVFTLGDALRNGGRVG